MYLNIYDFGYQADGIESAAKIYFNKKPSNLLIEESATLVGMLKNSSPYNPRRRLELTTDRRNIVFNQMFRNGLLSKRARFIETNSINYQIHTRFSPRGTGYIFQSLYSKFMQKW